MYCKNCGAQVEQGKFCHVCGAPMNEEPVEAPAVPVKTKKPGKGLGTVALLLGLAGLIISVSCCLPGYQYVGFPLAAFFGLLGFILSLLAKGNAKEAGVKNGRATAGVVFSLLTLIVVVLYWIFGSIVVALTSTVYESIFYSIV